VTLCAIVNVKGNEEIWSHEATATVLRESV
jgi:hypothetical protein